MKRHVIDGDASAAAGANGAIIGTLMPGIDWAR